MRKSIFILLFILLVCCVVCSAKELRVKSTQWLEDGALAVTLDGEEGGAWAPATRDSIAITPPADYHIMRVGNRVKIMANFQPGSYYELQLKKGFPNPGAPDGLAEEQCLRFITNDLRPCAEWLTSGQFYPLNASSWELPFYEVNVDNPLTITLSRLYRSSLLHFISSTKVWNGETTRVISEKITRFQGIQNRKHIFGISLSELGVERKPGIYALSLDFGQDKQGQPPATLRISVTDMSLSLFQNGQNYHCFVYSLSEPDKPCPGVSVYLYSEKQQLICDDITDNNGYVRLSLPPQWDEADHPHYLVATNEETQDSVWLLVDGKVASASLPNASNRAMPSILYADRGVCQRGSTITFTGLLRKGNGGVCSGMPVEIVVTSPEGEEVFAKECQTDNFGFVSEQMSIDSEATIGQYHVVLRPPRKQKGYTFVYAEMDFEVLFVSFASTESSFSVEQSSPETWSYRGEIIGTQGRPVANAPVDISVSLGWGDFVPPEQYADYDFSFPMESGLLSSGFQFQRQTNQNGVFEGTLPVSSSIIQEGAYCAPLDITVRTVTHATGNEGGDIVQEEHFLHHVFDYYLGVRVALGEDGAPRGYLCALRPDGSEYPLSECAFNYELNRYKWVYQLNCGEDGKYSRSWRQLETPVSRGAVELDGDGGFALSLLSEGSYNLLVKDQVTGQHLGYLAFPIGTDEIGELPLRPTELVFHLDRESYAPGDTATISFESLFSGVAYMLVGAQGSPVKHFRQPLKVGLNTVQVSIPQDCSGGACHLSVQAVAMENSLMNTQDVAYVNGEVEIPVNQSSRRVKVGIICPPEVAPGSTVPVQITLTDAEGNPVAGRVALWGVEEAVLRLSGYIHPTPFKDIFENTRSPFTMLSTYSSLFPVVTVESGHVGGDAPRGNLPSRQSMMSEYLQTFGGKVASARVSRQVFADVSANPDELAFVNVEFPSDECEFRLMAVASATTGVGGDDLVVQVKDKVEATIHAPSAMLPGDKSLFRAVLQNRQSSTEWFPCRLEILTPEYASRLSFQYDGILNIPMGEAGEISAELNLPEDIPAGEMVVRLTVKVSEIEEKKIDYAIQIRRPVHGHQAIFFQYVAPGETSAPWTNEKDKDVVKIGTLLTQLRAHQVWMNAFQYERLEQKMSSLFSNIHLQILEEKGLLKPLASGSSREAVEKELERLSLYRLGNGFYSQYLEGREGWLLGTSQILALEVMSKCLCGHGMAYERRQDILHTLKSILKDDGIPAEIKAYCCCTMGALGDINFYPYSLSVLGGAQSSQLARYLAGMALVIGGRAAILEGRADEGRGYVERGLSVVRELTVENFESVCRMGSSVNEATMLCNMAMVLCLAAKAVPGESILDQLFGVFMDRIEQSNAIHEYHLHAWIMGVITQYLDARGDELVTGPAQALLIRAEDEKIRHTITPEESLPMTVFEGGTYRLRNTGKIPLVVVSYKEEEDSFENGDTLAQNFNLVQSFRDGAGQEIHSCKVGDLVTVHVEVRSPALEDLVLEFQLPGGFVLEESCLKGRYAGEMQLAIASNAQGLVPHYMEKLPGELQWFGAVVPSAKEADGLTTAVYEYHLRAISSGVYHLPPVIATVTRGRFFQRVFTTPQELFSIEK